MSNLFGGGAKTASTTPTQAMGIQFNSSQYGPPVPVVYGTAKVGGSCIWYGDFKSTSHSQKVGKGGGGSTTSSYSYSASFQLALCEGPIAGIGNVYSGTSTVSLSSVGAVTATGAVGQAAWSHLSGGYALGYSQTALISVANLNLGSSASLPEWTPEVQGLQIQSGSQDANPANILNDICTNANYGINFPWLGSLTQYSNYCLATGLLLSPVYDQEQTGQQTLDDLLKYTNSACWFSEGVLKVQPYGDIAVTGNGVTYTPNVSPLVNLGEADYIVDPGQAPITVTRRPPAECMNMVRVQFQDRSNTYHTGVVVASIDYDLNTHGGRADDTEDVNMCKSGTVARFIAQNLVQRQFYVRNTYEFKLSWRYCYLEPMDILTLTDANLGLNQWPVRVTEVAEDASGVLSITAEEFPEGIGHSALYNTQPNNGATIDPNSDPGAVNPPYLFRGPGFLVSNDEPEIWCAVNGSGALWGGADIYLSHDGTSYNYIGTTAQPARYGSLSTALPTGSDPDTTNTPQVTLYAPAQLLGGSQADADNLNTLAMVDTELVSYETASLVSSNTYQLSYLRRGTHGSAIVAHSVGAPFVRLDDGIYRIPIDPSLIGQTVYLKFLSLNCFGRTPRTLAGETAYTYVVGTNVELPDVPPVPSNFTVTPVADGVSITWQNTNPSAVGCTSIERSTASTGPWTVIAQVGPTTTGYTDHFTSGSTYYYRARARGPLVQSGWSAYTTVLNSTGKTVANGADVTNQQTGITVTNPYFAGNLNGWAFGTGWYEEAAGSAHQPDPIISTYVVHAGSTVLAGSSATDAMVNASHIPVVPGQQVTVTCCVRELTVNAGALGYARISWRDANNNEIATSYPNGTAQYPTCGAAGTGTYTNCVTKVTAPAPAGAAYAVAEPYVGNHTSGYFTFCGVCMYVLPSSVDEVPDGSTFNRVSVNAPVGIEVVANGSFSSSALANENTQTPFSRWSVFTNTNSWFTAATNSNVADPLSLQLTGSALIGVGTTSSMYVANGPNSSNTFVCSQGDVYYVSGQTEFYTTDTTIPSGMVFKVTIGIAWFNSFGTFISNSLPVQISGSASIAVAMRTGYATAPAGAAFGAVQLKFDCVNNGSVSWTSVSGKVYYGNFGFVSCKRVSSLASEVTGTLSTQTNLPQRTVTNIPAKVPSVISYSATTTSATISVAAFTVLNGGSPVSYNAMSVSVSGSAGANTTFYLYFNDPTYAGGTQTLVATTNGNDLYQSIGTVYVGPVTVSFPTSGSGSGGGGGGGSGACVCDDMWIDDETTAGEALIGELFDCIDIPTQGQRKFRRRLQSAEYADVPCVRIETDQGAVLECSAATPFDLPSGGMTYAPEMEGLEVVTDRGVERVVSVIDIGVRRVCHIHLGGCSYAAGIDPNHRIYSHNTIAKP